MAKSDDTEENKVTGVEDVQSALEGTLAPGDEEETIEDESPSDDDDDSKNDSDEDDSDDSADDEDNSEDNSDENSEDDEDKSKGEPRFTQFKGDGTQEDYVKKLEDGYDNSSKEGIRLNAELSDTKRKLDAYEKAVAADPKLAESLKKALGSDDLPGDKSSDKSRDPFLRNTEREWREKSEEEASKFIDANPEVLSDPKINADVKKWMRIFSNAELEENDRLMTAGEAMAKAYDYLGYENKLSKSTDVAAKAKEAAAPTRPQPSKKKTKSTSKDFTDLQLAFADKMGVSKETLSKYNK